MKRSSVLSRLSFRWLAVVHLLMSTRHLEMCVVIWVSEGGRKEQFGVICITVIGETVGFNYRA